MIFHLHQIPQFIFFADDTNLTLSLSHSNVSTLQQNINDELVNVSNWFKVNKLSINFNKTELQQNEMNLNSQYQ